MVESNINADTYGLGNNFVVQKPTRRVAYVYEYGKYINRIENIPTITGATTYNFPTTNTTYILILKKYLYHGNRLGHSLVNTKQASGIGFLDKNYYSCHELVIDINGELPTP